MDVPDLPLTTAEILHNRMHAHACQSAETGEKDVELVVEALEYAYIAHGRRDQLPSWDELVGIVSRAYDEDVIMKMNLDEAQGRTSPDRDDQPYGQKQGYTGLIDGLNSYLGGKAANDVSEHVSTPERAQEYVESSRKFTAEMSKASLDEMAELDDEVDEEDTGAFDAIKKEFVSGLIDLAGQTDASIIAEAAVLYRDTEDGKRSFEGLRSLVDEVVKSHKLP